jgi:hypothetical protein
MFKNQDQCNFCQNSKESCCSAVQCGQKLSSESRLGVILGGIAGGIGLILVLVLIACIARNRRTGGDPPPMPASHSEEKPKQRLSDEEFKSKYLSNYDNYNDMDDEKDKMREHDAMTYAMTEDPYTNYDAVSLKHTLYSQLYSKVLSQGNKRQNIHR